MNTTWETLQFKNLNETQLNRLQLAWTSSPKLETLLRSFEVERAMTSIYYDGFRQSKAKRTGALQMMRELVDNGFGQDMPWGHNFDLLMKLRVWLWSIVWSDQEETHSLRIWEARIEGMREVQKQKSWYPKAESWAIEGQEVSRYNRFRFLAPKPVIDLSFIAWRICQEETQREMILAEIALRRFQLRYGKLPATLNDLTPEFLLKLPLDYMNAKPLRYRLLSETDYLLYSVGENGEDDGGDPIPLTGKTSKSIWNSKDVVWPRANASK